MKCKRCFLTLVLISIGVISFAQGVSKICDIANGGELKNFINKKEYSSITSLTINGVVGVKDFEIICQLTELQKLDLSRAHIDHYMPYFCFKWDGTKQFIPVKALDNEKCIQFCIVNLSKLKVLKLPREVTRVLVFGDHPLNLEELWIGYNMVQQVYDDATLKKVSHKRDVHIVRDQVGGIWFFNEEGQVTKVNTEEKQRELFYLNIKRESKGVKTIVDTISLSFLIPKITFGKLGIYSKGKGNYEWTEEGEYLSPYESKIFYKYWFDKTFMSFSNIPTIQADVTLENGMNTDILQKIKPEKITFSKTQNKIYIANIKGTKNVVCNDCKYIWPYAFATTKIESALINNIDTIPVGCFYKCQSLRKVDLPQTRVIGDLAFKGVKFETLNIPNATTICGGAFDSASIDKLNLPNVINIAPFAFYKSNIKKLTLDKIQDIGFRAFAFATIDTLVLSENLAKFSQCAFDCSNIGVIILRSKYAPEIHDNGTDFSSDVIDRYPNGLSPSGFDLLCQQEIIIPQGCLQNYSLGNWKKLRPQEAGRSKQSVSIQLKKVGDLTQKLSDKQYCLQIDSLTLSGPLSDLEFKYIRQCKFLHYLDLTNCTCYMSKATCLELLGTLAASYGFISGIAEYAQQNAQARYDNYEMKYQDALIQYATGGVTKKYMSSKEAKLDSIIRAIANYPLDYLDDKPIQIREHSLDGLLFLQEIRLPKAELINLEGYGTKNLRRLIIPEGVKNIRGFVNVQNLEEVVFPSSLKEINATSFSGTMWKKIDLSNTNLQEFSEYAFRNSHYLTEIRFPQTLNKEKFYYRFGDDFIFNIKSNYQIKFYFPSREKIFDIKGEVHIPRGCKAGWPNIDLLIDDIE